MNVPDLRALVLAAGRGERLRPLTDLLPKPLLPVLGKPLVAHTLERLVELGCPAAAINLCHLGEQIREHFGSRFAGLPLTYSPEPQLLGTLGALVPLREYFSGAGLILVVNGDSLCRWPLDKLVRSHLKSGADATLLCSTRADVERFGGGIGVDDRQRVISFRPAESHGRVVRRVVFAGAHVLSPRLLANLGEGPADFVQHLYRPLLAAGGQIQALLTDLDWHDLGTPRRYLEGVLGSRPGPPRRGSRAPDSWIDPGAIVEPSAQVHNAVIEAGAEVAAGAVVEASLVLPGARIRRGCEVREAVIGPQVVLPAESFVEGRMVCSLRTGCLPRPQDSVLGDLIYTPLELSTSHA